MEEDISSIDSRQYYESQEPHLSNVYDVLPECEALSLLSSEFLDLPQLFDDDSTATPFLSPTTFEDILQSAEVFSHLEPQILLPPTSESVECQPLWSATTSYSPLSEMRSSEPSSRMPNPVEGCLEGKEVAGDARNLSSPRKARYKFEEDELPLFEELMRTPDGQYVCPEVNCPKGKIFQVKSLFRKHLKWVYQVVKCPVTQCCYRSGWQIDMYRHVRSSHMKWANLNLGSEHKPKCQNCCREFSRSDNLLKHVRNGICLD